MHYRHLLGGLLGAVMITAASGRPAESAGVETYDVTIRYRINAVGNDRLTRYFAMARYLKSIGFVRENPDDVPANEPEDPQATRMRGSLPAAKVPLLFGDRHILAARLLPRGAKLAEGAGDKLAADKEQPRVRVSLRLAKGLPLARQRLLADQTRQVLAELGFQDAVGYDHRDFTRILGSIPVGQLDAVVEDLRTVPAGARQPVPFQNVSPVQIVEVQPNLPLPAARPAPVALPPGQDRLSPELRELLADETKAASPIRMEVLLAVAPDARDKTWQSGLAGVAIEGRLGSLVTVFGPPSEAIALAGQPHVVGVRLPRPGRSQVLAFRGKNSARPMVAKHAARLHALGHRGKGTRLAVVDADFHNWESQLAKSLPKTTQLIDLTREHNRNLQPDPAANGARATGVICAETAHRMAPEAELVLIRIDPSAPYMLETVARAINGAPVRSLDLDNRLHELEQDRVNLETRRRDLASERRIAQEDFAQQGEETQLRKDYIKKQSAFDRDERDLTDRARRYHQHVRDLAGLKGIQVATCALAWPEGYPVDGSSALSRSFDDRPFRAALWFQCVGDTRDQSWTGLLRDEDGNGIMEFDTADHALPEACWTSELNFLAWRSETGAKLQDLPAGARVRLSLTWREPHDATLWNLGEDGYRTPIANLHLVMLRQEDPAGRLRPADDLEVVAESAGVPLRLESSAGAGTYEQVVELRVAKAGRYAVRIEGRPPDSNRPPSAVLLPNQYRTVEVKPRLFAQTLEGEGRAVFDSFATEAASIAMPADAHYVTAIGASNADGQAQAYSAPGPAHNLDLLTKPEALATDEEEGWRGTGLAAAHAAGLAAALRSSGLSLAGLQESIKAHPGRLWPAAPRHPQR